jgi:anti-sigma B factor antagonist
MSQVKIEQQIGGAVLALSGQFIGGEETDQLKDALNQLSNQDTKKLVIDLKNTKYLNSTALGILIAAHTNFVKRDGKIVLANISKSIENIFIITKLTVVFNIADSVEEAIKSLSN